MYHLYTAARIIHATMKPCAIKHVMKLETYKATTAVYCSNMIVLLVSSVPLPFPLPFPLLSPQNGLSTRSTVQSRYQFWKPLHLLLHKEEKKMIISHRNHQCFRPSFSSLLLRQTSTPAPRTHRYSANASKHNCAIRASVGS